MNKQTITDYCELLFTNHGQELLYSYNKVVAGFIPVVGRFKVNGVYTKATQKCIDDYLKGEEVHIIPPKYIKELFYEQNNIDKYSDRALWNGIF